MGIGDWLKNLGRQLDDAGEQARQQRDRLPPPPTPQPSAGVANLHALVQTHRADVSAGILRTLEAGAEEAVVGLGRTVDVPLLPDDLTAADVLITERDLRVVAVRWTEKGWMLVREDSNFGVFWARKDSGEHWGSVKRRNFVEGLEPGDWLGLGSCPGDAVKCRLPLPPEGVQFAPASSRLEAWALDASLETAVLHWRYTELLLAADEDALVQLPERVGSTRLSLVRDLDRPSAGWTLTVLDAGPGVSYREPLGRRHALERDQSLTLTGQGHRLGLAGGLELTVPRCVAPTPRFDRRNPPSRQDIREVLGLGIRDLDDPGAVRSGWKQAARRFHPDRHDNAPGPTSRFVEAKACWESYQRLGPGS